ncbi:hypothetical protein [Kitasatospora sp. NPDC002040]|uniref:esterase/lipase family protein n=1 Tax=Kitasatospora sp. NPDC002040 TaxID=3154661 RepID=UPI00332B35DA
MARVQVNDLVVVVPGIMGSRLADRDGKPVWNLSGPAALRGLRAFAGLAPRLSVGPDGEDGGVRAVGLMRDLHVLPGVWTPVDGYDGLTTWLQQKFTLTARTAGLPAGLPVNLVEFAYDWRLSCRVNSARLATRVARELELWRGSAPERREARVVFVCHSMGGLIARHYVAHRGGWEVTRRLITLGTPHRGSLDALLRLVNGLAKPWLPSALSLTAFARSLPSLHELLPGYACLPGPDGTLLRPEEVTGLPGVDLELLAAAGLLHREIAAGGPAELIPFTGVRQPTPTTAEWDGERLVPLLTIGGQDEGGDGTVPRLAGTPVEFPDALVRTPREKHGSLQNHRSVRDELWGLLGPERPTHRGEHGDVELAVSAPDLVDPGEPYPVTVSTGRDDLAVTVTLTAVGGGAAVRRTMGNRGGGRYGTVFERPAPGAYRAVAAAEGYTDSAVTSLVLVGGEADGDA